MGRSILPFFLLLILMSLEACSSSGPARVHVGNDQTVDFAGKRNLSLDEFDAALTAFLEENQAEEGPIVLGFEAVDDAPILYVLQAKDVLRKHHTAIRLQLESADGNLREEELLPGLKKKENRSYEYLDTRNLMSVYLGADGEIFSDGALSKAIAKDQLVAELKTFIQSDPDNPELPELKESFLPGVGSVMCSKAHLIRVVPTSTTTYGWYNEINGLVDRAYDELWDDFSQENFGHPFAEAKKNEEALLKMVYPRKIVEDPNVAGY